MVIFTFSFASCSSTSPMSNALNQQKKKKEDEMRVERLMYSTIEC